MSAATLCGWEAPEPLQGIILDPLGAGLWAFQATGICSPIGRVLPGDLRLGPGISLGADPESTDPDALPGGVRASASVARNHSAVIEATTSDFRDFAATWGGVAFRALGTDRWVIKGIAPKMRIAYRIFA